MLSVVAMVLAVDGGGDYSLVSDLQWPRDSVSMVSVTNDYEVRLPDGGEALGAQSLFHYDGGVLVDSRGLYAVRGRLGTPNVWYDIRASDIWVSTPRGGKYEWCWAPGFSSWEWRDGESPYWDGVPAYFDINQVSQHVVTIIPGAINPGEIYVRLNGSAVTTMEIHDLSWRAGQTYCTSVEWTPNTLIDGGVSDYCRSWVRHDSCDDTPVEHCHASTIVAFTDGDGSCPNDTPTHITIGNRQDGWDVSNLAPGTFHTSALREFVKPTADGGW